MIEVPIIVTSLPIFLVKNPVLEKCMFNRENLYVNLYFDIIQVGCLQNNNKEIVFYAPNFEEVEGAYWFWPVRPSICLSVCLSVTLFGSSETQEPLMLES